jgi:CheY-like chemotaxis protein
MTHTVLVVEDEDDVRESLRELLELSGYTVVAAADGQEALDHMAGIEHVCVVLLDLIMPRMNGWDFFTALRADPHYAAVPVVVHSSSPDDAPDGVTRVLRKPVELSRLLSIVQEFCTA